MSSNGFDGQLMGGVEALQILRGQTGSELASRRTRSEPMWGFRFQKKPHSGPKFPKVRIIMGLKLIENELNHHETVFECVSDVVNEASRRFCRNWPQGVKNVR